MTKLKTIIFLIVLNQIVSGNIIPSERDNVNIENFVSVGWESTENSNNWIFDQFRHVADDIATNAAKFVRENILNVKARADELINQIKNIGFLGLLAAQEASKCIHEQFENQLKTLAARAEASDIDVKDCTKVMYTFRSAVANLISNSSLCITEKLDKATYLFMDVTKKSDFALNAVSNFSIETAKCMQSVQNAVGMFSAARCTLDAKIQEGFKILRQLPGIAVDTVEIIDLLATLPDTLPLCMTKQTFKSIEEESNNVIDSVQTCINEKLKN
ncbi:uncharacterized protein LOC106649242 [Trichogramma pretiosum]|uniref:uncharacterized protein LOC106649242 n=1 Tax=Trichogramma pretiosum TaxID=7493 RepID=UPI0006C9A837|nr:uncharacterized protein LOC106649242 [Trichogramma pretiosum]